MYFVRGFLLFLHFGMSYSYLVNEPTHHETLVFIYPGVSPTAADVEEVRVQCVKEQALEVFYDRLARSAPPYPVAIVSGLCPEATEALAAVSKHYCLPLVSYSTSLEFPNKEDSFTHLFSVVPSDHYFAVATVHFINHYKWRRAIIITKDQDHNKQIKEQFLALLQSRDVSVIGDFVLPTPLSRINDINLFLPDVRVFILNVDCGEAKVIFCLALRENIGQYSYVWIIPGWYADRWWEAGGDVILRDHHGCSTSELAAFIAKQRVVAISHHPTVLNTTLSGDEVCIQDNITRALSSDAKQVVMNGLQPSVVKEFAGSSDICGSRMEMSLCSPDANDCFNKTLTSMRNTDIQGDSGVIEFNEVGSRIPSVVNVFQYRTVDECKVQVAVINITADRPSLEFVGGEDILWVGGVPSDGTPRTREDFVPLWLSVTANIWSILVILTSIAFIVFMFAFRKRKLVRLTSPSLNYVIAIGIIMFNIGGMMFIQHRVPVAVLEVFCTMRSWLVSIGISLSFVTIDAKMLRIFYIFHYPNPSKRKKVLQDWHLFVMVMLCVVVDVLILTVAASVESARLKPVEMRDVRHGTEVDEEGITLNYSVRLCSSRWRLVWLGMLFGYKALIQLIGLIVALKIRNVKIDVLNDSKEIAMAIYFTTTILVVVIIVTIVWDENLTIYSAAYAYGSAVSTTAILVIVFFTKVYKLYKDPWGEKIFSNEHGTGPHALSVGAATGNGTSLFTNSTNLLASTSDDDRTRALAHKLRLVELELEKYKGCEVVDIDKMDEKGTRPSTRTAGSERDARTE